MNALAFSTVLHLKVISRPHTMKRRNSSRMTKRSLKSLNLIQRMLIFLLSLKQTSTLFFSAAKLSNSLKVVSLFLMISLTESLLMHLRATLPLPSKSVVHPSVVSFLMDSLAQLVRVNSFFLSSPSTT